MKRWVVLSINYYLGVAVGAGAARRGIDYDFERRIAKVVGRERRGSGYSFVTGRRDLVFSFKIMKAATNAKDRIKSTFGRKVRTKITTGLVFETKAAKASI